MRKLIVFLTALAIGAMLWLPLSASAQMAESAQSQTHTEHTRTSMMERCHTNMRDAMRSNDELKREIEEARRSNDPTKMRSALDAAEKHLTLNNRGMNMCMNMMSGMHGHMGMMGGSHEGTGMMGGSGGKMGSGMMSNH